MKYSWKEHYNRFHSKLEFRARIFQRWNLPFFYLPPSRTNTCCTYEDGRVENWKRPSRLSKMRAIHKLRGWWGWEQGGCWKTRTTVRHDKKMSRPPRTSLPLKKRHTNGIEKVMLSWPPSQVPNFVKFGTIHGTITTWKEKLIPLP